MHFLELLYSISHLIFSEISEDDLDDKIVGIIIKICYYPKENQYPFYNTYLLFLKQRQYNQIKQKKPVLKTQAIIPHINSEKNSPPTITKVVCDNLTQFCQTSFSVATLGTF